MALQAVRTFSVPEPLPLDLPSDNNPSNLSAINSVASLGAWNTSEYSHLDTPASSPQAAVLSQGSPRDANFQAQLQRLLHGASAHAPSTPAPAGQVAAPAAQLPAQPAHPPAAPAAAAAPQKVEEATQPSAGASDAEATAQLVAESATLPTIAEEEPTRAIDPTEGAPIQSQ